MTSKDPISFANQKRQRAMGQSVCRNYSFILIVYNCLFTCSRAAAFLNLSALHSQQLQRLSTTTRNSRLQTTIARHSSSSNKSQMASYPELTVFDLDACFWDQEMYQMGVIPNAENVVMGDLNSRGQGVIGVMSGGHQISLHKGSLLALQNHADGIYGDMKVAFASSADTPLAEKCGRASLQLLEVLPGLTVWDLVVGRDWQGRDINQIGRQPPLSSNKSATHFPFLKRATGIRYDRMLFFDDCGWDDHCGMVSSRCKEPDTNQGPATVRTPSGLRVQDWNNGLEVYAKQAAALASSQSS